MSGTNSSLDSNKSQGTITSQLSKIDIDEDFELVVSINSETIKKGEDHLDTGKVTKKTLKSQRIIDPKPTRPASKRTVKSSVTKRNLRMKDRKMISEYEIVKEILDENPEFLEKYLQERNERHALKRENSKNCQISVDSLKIDFDNDDIETIFVEKVREFLTKTFNLENEEGKLTLELRDFEETIEKKTNNDHHIITFDFNPKQLVLNIFNNNGENIKEIRRKIEDSMKWLKVIFYYVYKCKQFLEKINSTNFLLSIAQ